MKTKELTLGYILTSASNDGANRLTIYKKAPFLWPFFENLIGGLSEDAIKGIVREQITNDMAEKIFEGKDMPHDIAGLFNRATSNEYIGDAHGNLMGIYIDNAKWNKFCMAYYNLKILHKSLVKCVKSSNYNYLNNADQEELKKYMSLCESGYEENAPHFFLLCIRIGINRQVVLINRFNKEHNKKIKKIVVYKNAFHALVSILHNQGNKKGITKSGLTEKIIRLFVTVYKIDNFSCSFNDITLRSYANGYRELPVFGSSEILLRYRDAIENSTSSDFNYKAITDFLNEFIITKKETIFSKLWEYLSIPGSEFYGKTQSLEIIEKHKKESNLESFLCSIMTEYTKIRFL